MDGAYTGDVKVSQSVSSGIAMDTCVARSVVHRPICKDRDVRCDERWL